MPHELRYDASGNAIRYDGLCLRYNARDRLTEIPRLPDPGSCWDCTSDACAPQVIEQNTYDFKDRRTMRLEYRDADGTPIPDAPRCTSFVYDQQDRLLAEHDCATYRDTNPAGNVVAEYVYLEGYHILAVRRRPDLVSPMRWYWYANDHLPTPRKVVDEVGDVVWDGRIESAKDRLDVVPSVIADLRPGLWIPAPARGNGGAAFGSIITGMNRLQPAIVFDFGGVLVDWDPHYLYRPLFNGDDAAIDRFMQEIDFREWNMHRDGGRSFDEGVAVLSAQFPQYAHLIRAYHDHYADSIVGPIAGTVDILRACQTAGYALYGLSNWAQEKFDLIRPKYDFFDCFDDILISSTVNLIKPDRRIFEIFLQRIGRRAEECVYIDDSAANVAAAHRLGFITIHFTSPAQLAAELDRLDVIHLNGHR